MTASARRILLVVLALGALGLTACEGTGKPENRISGRRLTIYTSLPLIGPSRVSGQAALNGARIAVAAIHGRIGRYRIVMRSLDDATVASRGWDPGQTTADARAAIRDKTTIGYVGDLNSGATAVAIPLLNRAKIPQISPLSTAVGLTEGGSEASPGEPQKYYPLGVRTFARVIPNDKVQSAAQVTLQREAGCRRVYVLFDREVDGRDAAMSFQIAAKRAHLSVVGSDQFDPTAKNYTSLGATLARLNPDCVLISALPQDNAVLVTEAVAHAVPDAQLFGTAGLAEMPYVHGLPESIGPRMVVTSAALATPLYPPAGRRFNAQYARLYGGWRPDAIFGYEAMSLMLNAISRATDGGTRAVTRSRVLRAIFATHDRHSVLGTYSIDREGDTTLDRFGAYQVNDGRLVFWKALVG